jgi:hypothetical protein
MSFKTDNIKFVELFLEKDLCMKMPFEIIKKVVDHPTTKWYTNGHKLCLETLTRTQTKIADDLADTVSLVCTGMTWPKSNSSEEYKNLFTKVINECIKRCCT